MVRRLGRCSSGVRHRVVPDRERVPDRCPSSESAVGICSDAPAETQQAAYAADGGMVDVWPARAASPRVRRMPAQRVARFGPSNTRNCLPPNT